MKTSEVTGVVIAVVIVFVIGFVIGNYTGYFVENEEDNGHTHTLPHSHGNMTHGMVEVKNYTNIPTVDLVVHVDPKAGWNLQVKTTNFVWAPWNASLEHVPGEGHAHLYIDGDKVTRIYGEWYLIPELTSGMHEIKVSLSANNHDDYVLDGVVIADTEMITV
jgi:hypothetical protein